MPLVILCILSHAFIQNVILRRGPQASLLNCRTVHGTNARSPLTHRPWPEQRSPQPAGPMLPKGILSSRLGLWRILLFSCVPLLSENTSWEEGHIRTLEWEELRDGHGSTRHKILSSPNVGHTGQPSRNRSLVFRELPLAYGKMCQDDRCTALFKSLGSYWYHLSPQMIKPLVVGKVSEVYLVISMLKELGDIISHFLSTLIEGIIHMTHNSLT